MTTSLKFRKFAKRSKASKANWAKIPKEERSKRMRKLATDRQAKMTVEEKHEHAMKMVRARQ